VAAGAAYGRPAGFSFLIGELTPTSITTSPTAINNRGQVVGTIVADHSTDFKLFLWSNGTMTFLGRDVLPPGVSHSAFATDLNDHGIVIGGFSFSDPDQGTVRDLPFRWEAGVMTDLNDLLPPGSGWRLRSAWAINERGWIVGTGIRDGAFRGYLLRPLDEP
jgi:probable HAF family extracellular repeat protein